MKYLHTASDPKIMLKMEAFSKSIYFQKYKNANKLEANKKMIKTLCAVSTWPPYHSGVHDSC